MPFIEFEKSVRQNDWSMQELHSHAHYELYFLSKGNRSFFLSNALYRLEAPAHKTEGDPFERYNINVSDDYLDPFQRDTLRKNALQFIRPTPAQTEQLISLFEDGIAVEQHRKHTEYLLKSIFSYTVFTLNKLDAQALPPSAAATGDIPPLVLKVIDHLNAHYAEKQTLDDLAETFFVAKSTLVYNFKKYTNCSLIDFLLNVRLTKAKEMLVNTKKSVGEISEACGFSSANYFGLIFKAKEK